MTAEEEKEGQNKGCLMSVWTKAQTSSFVEADSYNHIMQCIFQFNTIFSAHYKMEIGIMASLTPYFTSLLQRELSGWFILYGVTCIS